MKIKYYTPIIFILFFFNSCCVFRPSPGPNYLTTELRLIEHTIDATKNEISISAEMVPRFDPIPNEDRINYFSNGIRIESGQCGKDKVNFIVNNHVTKEEINNFFPSNTYYKNDDFLSLGSRGTAKSFLSGNAFKANFQIKPSNKYILINPVSLFNKKIEVEPKYICLDISCEDLEWKCKYDDYFGRGNHSRSIEFKVWDLEIAMNKLLSELESFKEMSIYFEIVDAESLIPINHEFIVKELLPNPRFFGEKTINDIGVIEKQFSDKNFYNILSSSGWLADWFKNQQSNLKSYEMWISNWSEGTILNFRLPTDKEINNWEVSILVRANGYKYFEKKVSINNNGDRFRIKLPKLGTKYQLEIERSKESSIEQK